MEPTLSAHVAVAGLSKRYGAANVRARVDLSVDKGALITLLSPSGFGQTTLLRLIACYFRRRLRLDRRSGCPSDAAAQARRPSRVPKLCYALFPHLTVGGNVGFGPQRRGLPRDTIAAKVGQALELVQMGAYADRPVRALSGGQQQRVALARALAVEPSVLLFDEALSALDRSLRETMQVELRRLLKRIGATAVLVTHDQDEALTMSDGVAVMNAGRIEHFEDPIGLYARPRTLLTMRFVGISSELRGTVIAHDACADCMTSLRDDLPLPCVNEQMRAPAHGQAVSLRWPVTRSLAFLDAGAAL